MRYSVDRLLVAILVLALIASGYTLVQRSTVERANRRLEIAVDYAQVQQLVREARGEGIDSSRLYQRLRQSGATGILFKEQSSLDLEQVGLLSGKDPLLWFYASQLGFPVDLNGSYFVTGGDAAVLERIKQQLELKGFIGTNLGNEELHLFYVPTEKNDLAYLGLGFPEDELYAATRQGLNTLLQVKSWQSADAQSISSSFKPLAAYPNLSAVLFNDYKLPGYPQHLPALTAAVADLGVPLATVEFFDQQGLKELSSALNKNVVRLHSLGVNEVKNYGSTAEILDRFTLAAKERNARILLVRFKPDSQGKLVLGDAEELLQQLHQALAAEGFSFGPAQPFASIPVSRVTLFFMGLGSVAAGMLFLRKIKWQRMALVLGIVAVLVWAGLLGLGYLNLGRKLMALATAVVFPVLAITIIKKDGMRNLTGVLGEFLKTSAVSLSGGLIVGALLTDLSFMLKLQQFIGVKAAHVIPLLLMAATLFCLADREWLQRIRNFFSTPLTVAVLVAAAALVVVAIVYIGRTGNESAPVSGLELLMRDFLGNWLGVRPRTKEFLIGHPLLLLSIYLGYKHRFLPLWLLGAIGQISLVNTYAHIHTPIAVSLLRSFNGLWLGAVLGLLLIGFWLLVERHEGRWLKWPR